MLVQNYSVRFKFEVSFVSDCIYLNGINFKLKAGKAFSIVFRNQFIFELKETELNPYPPVDRKVSFLHEEFERVTKVHKKKMGKFYWD